MVEHSVAVRFVIPIVGLVISRPRVLVVFVLFIAGESATTGGMRLYLWG